jgi:transcriptional regulator GlxA family with amidase domain
MIISCRSPVDLRLRFESMPNPNHFQSNADREKHRIGFVLVPGFSMLGLVSATEVLRVANELLGHTIFESISLAIDDNPVSAFGSFQINVAASIEDCAGLTDLFIVAESMPAQHDPRIATLADIGAALHANGGVLGGIGTGAAWWAQAGLMDGYRCTLPRAHAASLITSHAGLCVSSSLYEIDRNRLSCMGLSTSLDLMVVWLGQQFGDRFQQSLLTHFSLERVREPQMRIAAAAAHPGASSKFAEAVALMQSNLSEPLTTEDVASLVGVSRRQLERLFKQHLDTLPSRWYLEQRLALARRLLQESSQSILQVGLSCGFTSAAHFSNAYRNHFDRTPRDERSARAAAWRNAPIAAGALATPIASGNANPQLHQLLVPEKDQT